MKDPQQNSVYDAENVLRRMYEALRPGQYTVNVGFDITLAPEARFGSLESVQRYVDRVTQMPSVVAEFGNRGRVKVVHRPGSKKATYTPGTNSIALHDGRDNWAMRELVILHELAHHYSPGAGHGPSFAHTFVTLVGLVMGPEVGLALRVLFDQHDVQCHSHYARV